MIVYYGNRRESVGISDIPLFCFVFNLCTRKRLAVNPSGLTCKDHDLSDCVTICKGIYTVHTIKTAHALIASFLRCAVTVYLESEVEKIRFQGRRRGRIQSDATMQIGDAEE